MELFQYISKKHSNSLFSKYDYEDIKNKIVIQSSKYDEVILFNSVEDFVKFNDETKNKIYNEIIFADDIQKFKLDIDVKDNYFDEDELSSFIRDCIKYVKKILNIGKIKFVIFDSSDSSRNIYSRHVVFNVYLATCYDSKFLFDGLLKMLKCDEKYDDDMLRALDSSVYKTVQGFRLPYHAKAKDIDRIKTPINIDNLHILDGMIKYYGLDQVPNPISFPDKIKHSKIYNHAIDDVILEEILKTAKEHLVNFKIRSVTNNMIAFDRIKEGFCSLCNKTHSNENSIYIRVYYDKFRLYCRRNSNGDHIEYKLNHINEYTNISKIMEIKEYSNSIDNQIFTNENISMFNKDSVCVYQKPRVMRLENLDKKVTFIHSGVKTGKTKMLSKYIEESMTDDKICIMISFRILFSIDVCKKFPKFVNYLDIKSQTYNIRTLKRIIIQLESIHKLVINEKISLLILDEVEAILNQFTSPYVKYLKLIWEIFKLLIDISDKIICMDANITPRTITTFQSLVNKRDMIYCYNLYSSINTDDYNIILSSKVFIYTLTDFVKNNKKLIIPVNSLKYAKIILKYLKLNFSSTSVKLYSSESDDYIKRKELENVESTWVNYDVVIYTPCITAGVSFETKHFDYLLGYFNNLSCDVFTMYQMLYRVRNLTCQEQYIYFDIFNNAKESNNLDVKDIMESLKYSYKYLYNEAIKYSIEYVNNDVICNIDETDPFFILWINTMILKSRTYDYILKDFIKLLKINKCSFKIIYKLDDNRESPVINLKQMNLDIQKEENEKILEAKDINPETCEILSKFNLLTEEEKFMMKKYRLKSIFKVDDIDMNFLLNYNNPNTITQCLNVCLMKNFIMPIEELLSKHGHGVLNDKNFKFVDITNKLSKLLKFKCIYNIINYTGLSLDKIDTTTELLDVYNNNIAINAEKINEEYKKMNIYKFKKVSHHDINKLVNETWGMSITPFKITKGGQTHVKILKCDLFNHLNKYYSV